jgi:phosphomevalonate kinase
LPLGDDASKAPKPSEVRKTGLGSSAGLVVSITASLLEYFGVIQNESNKFSQKDLDLIHNLAQVFPLLKIVCILVLHYY